MRVSHLVEILSRVPQDAEVKTWSDLHCCLVDIEVNVEHDGLTGHLLGITIGGTDPKPEAIQDAHRKLNEELNRLNKPVDFNELAQICEELGFEVITFDEEPPEHVN
jgi:hypothetical protein